MQRKTAKQPLMTVDWRWQRKNKKFSSLFSSFNHDFLVFIFWVHKRQKNILGGVFKYEKWLHPISHFFSTVEINLNFRVSKSTELTGWSGSKAKTKQVCKAKINKIRLKLLSCYLPKQKISFCNCRVLPPNFNETIYSQIIFIKSVQYNGIRFYSTCGSLS